MNTRMITCAALLALAANTAGCAAVEDNKPLGAGAPVQEAQAEPAARNADGEYNLSCAYELGDFGESGDPARGYRFTAGGTLINTGNTNIRVRVTYQWKRLGSSAAKVRKVYRVKQGQERDVNVTVPASQSDISAHQNADAGCKATAKIVASY